MGSIAQRWGRTPDLCASAVNLTPAPARSPLGMGFIRHKTENQKAIGAGIVARVGAPRCNVRMSMLDTARPAAWGLGRRRFCIVLWPLAGRHPRTAGAFSGGSPKQQ